MEDILRSIRKAQLPGTLYHYTSLASYQKILESKCIWATEVNYLNDTSEISNFTSLVKHRASVLHKQTDDIIYKQLCDWLQIRSHLHDLLFVASLSENGNLLSQWRGYCEYGAGISIGWDTDYLEELSRQNNFIIAKCIYDQKEKHRVAQTMVERIYSVASRDGPDEQANQTQSYHPIFSRLEHELLRISAVFKNASFSEENEWRLISSCISNYQKADIKYRAGKFALIPYIEFNLETAITKPRIFELIIGPSPMANQSINSAGMLNSKLGVSPHIVNSGIPYRE